MTLGGQPATDVLIRTYPGVRADAYGVRLQLTRQAAAEGNEG